MNRNLSRDGFQRRWVTSIRLQLEHLEERTQPGSLLLTGLELPIGLENARPMPSAGQPAALQKKVDQDDFIVAEMQAIFESATETRLVQVATASAVEPLRKATDSPMPGIPSNIRHERAARPVTNSIARARPINDSVVYPPVQRNSGNATANLQTAREIITRATHETPAPGVAHPSQGRIEPLDPSMFKPQPCDDGSGRVNIYNTYDGTAANDENLSVASGKGPNIGEAYVVGYKGIDGTISRFSAAGACLGSMLFSNPNGVKVKDVTTNANGVYLVGTIGNGLSGFVARLNPSLGFIGGVTLPAPPNGAVELNGVGFTLNPISLNIFVTGRWNDPSFAPYDVTKVAGFTPVLGPLFDVNIDFLAPSTGYSIDADRGGHTFVAGRLAGFGVNPLPHTFRYDPGSGTVPWSFITHAGSPFPDVENGMFGVRLLGGVLPPNGVYTTGSVRDVVLNPGWQNLLLFKRNPGTGAIIYGFIYSSPGIDLAGRANAVDRNGEHFITGYIGNGANRDAIVRRYSFSGATLLDSTTLGGVGFQDRGYGIDLRTGAPGDNVMVAGMTTTPQAGQVPAPVGCDVTYNGLMDGFAAMWSQPF